MSCSWCNWPVESKRRTATLGRYRLCNWTKAEDVKQDVVKLVLWRVSARRQYTAQRLWHAVVFQNA